MKELLKIFLLFAKMGASTFGGGYAALPVMQHEMVDKQGWLSEQELTDCYALAQCQPGLIYINTAVLAIRPRLGPAAAAAATLGIAAPSFIIILLIAALLFNYAELPLVQQALAGVRVAVAATVVHSAWRLIKSGVRDWLSALIALAALALLLLKVNPIPIILGAAALALGQSLWRQRKAKAGKGGGAA